LFRTSEQYVFMLLIVQNDCPGVIFNYFFSKDYYIGAVSLMIKTQLYI